MPHVLRRQGILTRTGLAVFLAAVHTVNDAITAILGALPTLQERFQAGPMLVAVIVATYWVASSVTQPIFGALAEELGLRLVGMLGVLFAALFLSLIGVASELVLVFALLVIGGMGSAALHPVGTTIAGGPGVPNRTLGVGFFTAGGMIGFAVGPVLILYLVSRYGTGATPWLMLPGLVLGVLVYLLLPDWAPHRRRAVRALVDPRLLRGPVGQLAVAGSLSSITFLTFTSAVPVWLVRDQGWRRASSWCASSRIRGASPMP
jgi:MFS transporter, FSR family, fosmidomycin resistance protein